MFHINNISLLCSFYLKDSVENHIFLCLLFILLYTILFTSYSIWYIFPYTILSHSHFTISDIFVIYTNTMCLNKRCVVLNCSMTIVLNVFCRFTITETWGWREQFKAVIYNWQSMKLIGEIVFIVVKWIISSALSLMSSFIMLVPTYRE